MESDPNSMLYFIANTWQASKLPGKWGKSLDKSYEVPDREMTRKLKKKTSKKQENFTGYRVKALQLDYGNRSRENIANV